MILDKENMFSEAQALSASAASSNVIDLGAAGANAERTLPIFAQLNAPMGGTSPTLQAKLQSSVDAAFSSPVDHQSSAVIAGGAAGQKIELGVLPKGIKRYVRIYYTLGGTTPSADVTAGLVGEPQTNA